MMLVRNDNNMLSLVVGVLGIMGLVGAFAFGFMVGTHPMNMDTAMRMSSSSAMRVCNEMLLDQSMMQPKTLLLQADMPSMTDITHESQNSDGQIALAMDRIDQMERMADNPGEDNLVMMGFPVEIMRLMFPVLFVLLTLLSLRKLMRNIRGNQQMEINNGFESMMPTSMMYHQGQWNPDGANSQMMPMSWTPPTQMHQRPPNWMKRPTS